MAARVVADPTLLATGDDAVSAAIDRALREQLSISVPIEVMHDAAAAALGETGAGGTLAGCRNCVFVVWGTGIASGIIHDGCLYWCDSAIGTMTGEIGNLVVRRRNGSWTYRPSRSWLTIAAPEATLDQWLCGPAITRRFRRQVADDPRGPALLAACERPRHHLELPDVAVAAAGGDAFAAELIVGAGDEMGAALVPFVRYWKTDRGMPFADTIIIGSGVALLGELADSQGRSLLLNAVRARMAGECDPSGIILSRIGYERELMAFAGAFGGAN